MILEYNIIAFSTWSMLLFTVMWLFCGAFGCSCLAWHSRVLHHCKSSECSTEMPCLEILRLDFSVCPVLPQAHTCGSPRSKKQCVNTTLPRHRACTLKLVAGLPTVCQRCWLAWKAVARRLQCWQYIGGLPLHWKVCHDNLRSKSFPRTCLYFSSLELPNIWWFYMLFQLASAWGPQKNHRKPPLS